MRIIRKTALLALIGTVGCNIDSVITAPAYAPPVLASSVAPGTSVQVAAYFYASGNIQAGTRLVITSCEPVPVPFVLSLTTYSWKVNAVHLGDGDGSSNLFTDTELAPGTMLQALAVPLASFGRFEAAVIGH